MNRPFYFVAVAIFLVAASAGLILFAQGFQFNPRLKTLEKTGMIAVKSRPDGAKVYLDGDLAAVTNGSLSGLKEGFYDLSIKKEGFFNWEGKVEVKKELVTEIDALLIPLSPALSPLTSTGVKNPVLSTNRDRIAFTRGGEKSGLYQLSLTGNSGFLGLLRANIAPVALDTSQVSFSAAEALFWSPDDQEMLIQMNPAGFYVLNLAAANNPKPEATASAKPTLAEWSKDQTEKNRLLAARADVPPVLEKVATSSATLWSPDEKKFIYKRDAGDQLEYWIHDGSQPLGVARKRENLVLTVARGKDVNLSWFSDSAHLILVDEGTVSLIEVDRGKRTPVYSGNLASDQVFPTPAGDKLIILTKFIEGAATSLYAVSLR